MHAALLARISDVPAAHCEQTRLLEVVGAAVWMLPGWHAEMGEHAVAPADAAYPVTPSQPTHRLPEGCWACWKYPAVHVHDWLVHPEHEWRSEYCEDDCKTAVKTDMVTPEQQLAVPSLSCAEVGGAQTWERYAPWTRLAQVGWSQIQRRSLVGVGAMPCTLGNKHDDTVLHEYCPAWFWNCVTPLHAAQMRSAKGVGAVIS